ncbi:glycosyltransferase family 2 protein [Butyrivibrio sp. M55]|uniref:glycosyltransferase family 2 protein n=1 Tax=Butyrivibrio sp. M55 TaxID=1855323 RepID=UPI0008ED3253|nr:glycosyltransferase family 2 protein [Butyrivibrio sp. M55]SFU60925.1 dolichol-phosphate mannosyltransferase [Butyrivibrio sp. M55]
MSKLSIVIPVYYNSDTLELLYDDLKEKVLGKLEEYEIVFVDDGSGDNSWEIINKIAAMDKNVVATKLSRNFGEHAALLAGLSVCTGDCAVTKQADLQEDSTLILEMYESWKRGNKVVLAIRGSRDENAVKKFFAGCYYWLVRKTINKDMPQGGCDCYLVDRQVIKVLEMMDEKNSSLTLQVMWVGFKTEKIYFHRKDREVGKSRWTLGKKIKLVVDSMMSFSYFPIRCMATIGSVFALLSLVGIILTIKEKLTTGTPILGYASLMSVVLFGFGLIFIMLSMLGEYIWRALEESRKRPPFIIDEVKRSQDDKDVK